MKTPGGGPGLNHHCDAPFAATRQGVLSLLLLAVLVE
jgi:hypothetical protein